MTYFLKVRKTVKEKLGIEWDMKSSNPNFGKKNTFKKSQMRSVIKTVWIPVFVLFNAAIIAVSLPLYFCCCFKKKTTKSAMGDLAQQKMAEAKSKADDAKSKKKKKN